MVALALPLVMLVCVGGSKLISSQPSPRAQTRDPDPLSHKNWEICWELLRESDTKGATNGISNHCDNYILGTEDKLNVFKFEDQDRKIIIKYVVVGQYGNNYQGYWVWKVNDKEKGRGNFSFKFIYSNMAVGWSRDTLGCVTALRVSPI